MRLPIVKGMSKYSRKITVFGGLNRTCNYSDGELYDCGGISHELFPALTQKRKSVIDIECNSPSAAAFYDKKCIASNDALYYDGEKVGDLKYGKKSIAYVGYMVVVFPDKVYYNTKTKEFASLENECSLEKLQTTFTANTISVPGEVYEDVVIAEENRFQPDDVIFKYTGVSTENGQLEFSGFSLVKAAELLEGDIFSETSGKSYYRLAKTVKATDDGEIIISGNRVSVRNRCDKIFSDFRAGDIVEISGCRTLSNNKSLKIMEVTETSLAFDENAFEEATEISPIIIKRKIPDLSCIANYENRLWGCDGNTIYASALGDPLNFYKYDNLSTDSYAVESNTSGEFTAIAPYTNCCLFFKADKCYKLYGNRPSNFQLTEFQGAGILKEDKDSIVCLDGKIFYKGNGGIYAFYGGIPQCISDKLGNITMKNCVAGKSADCYYISCDTENGREEFVYDIEKGVWSKSGEKNVGGYYSYGEEIYRLKPMGVEKATSETDCEAEWFAELCPFNENYHKKKNYSKLYITVSLFENAFIKAEVKIDSNEWKTLAIRYGREKEHITIPCVLKGCNEIRLRLSGKGKSIVESVVREFSVG